MDRDRVIGVLRAHEGELRAAGVTSLSLFGSVARGEYAADSDIDVAVRLGDQFSNGGFRYFGRLDALEGRLAQILDRRVDVVEEPVREQRLQEEIEKDRVLAF